MEFFNLFLTDNFPEEKKQLLHCITFDQYKYFQSLIDNILFDDQLFMTTKEDKFFRKNKEILRTISQKKFSSFVGYYLGSHINLLKEVIKVTQKNDEPHSSPGLGASGNMEKSQSKDAGSDEESSDTDPSSPDSDSFRNDEEEEEEDEDQPIDEGEDKDNECSTTSSSGGGEEKEDE
jgi:hypothetical protein